MALVDLAPSVTFTLKDETGSTSNVQVNFDAATAVATVRTAANALVPLIAAISRCSVQGYRITFPTYENAPVAPAAKSRVEQKGIFIARTAAAKTARISIPGINTDYVLSSGRIDDDAAPVAAFRAALFGAPWTDSNGSDLAVLEKAYEASRTTTRRQLPSDRNTDANAVAESDPA